MQYDKHTGARENGGGTQQFGRIAPKTIMRANSAPLPIK